jgi:hypothetical protein
MTPEIFFPEYTVVSGIANQSLYSSIFLFLCCCALKISCSGKFFVAVKALKMAVDYGECGRECMSEHGNTANLFSLSVSCLETCARRKARQRPILRFPIVIRHDD